MTKTNRSRPRKKASSKNKTSVSAATIKGNGDYKTVIDSLASKMDKLMLSIPRGTFSAMGGALGGPAGALLGQGISAISGYGDYKVNVNSVASLGYKFDGGVPRFGVGSITVKHREFIGDVIAPSFPSVFTNRVYRFNPGNSTTFPWLSTLANSYQQYVPKGAVVYFKSSSSDYAATSGIGTVTIAANYNVLDPPYANEVEMQNSEFSVSEKPSVSLMHAVECDPNKMSYKQYYTAPSNVQATPTNDFCTIQVATTGLVATPGTVIGKLWMAYEIKLSKPIISNAFPLVRAYYQGWDNSTGLIFGDNSIAASLQGGDDYQLNAGRIVYSDNTVTAESVMQITRDNLSNPTSVVKFYRAGYYYFSYSRPITGGSGTFVSILGGGAGMLAFPNNITSTSSNFVACIKVPSGVNIISPATWSIDWSAAPSSVGTGSMEVVYSPV